MVNTDKALIGVTKSKLDPKFFSNEILSTIASSETEVSHFSMLTMGQICNQSGILVIGMGRYIEDALRFS